MGNSLQKQHGGKVTNKVKNHHWHLRNVTVVYQLQVSN